jgi:hypothetical protein
MSKANFPNHFVNIVKSLYENAYTSVIINEIQSSKYREIRGVRQGEPFPVYCSI